MDLDAIRAELSRQRLDGWLFVDFRRRDPIAYDVLGLPEGTPSRRWAYLIPAEGPCRKLLHRIEPRQLDTLPGTSRQYATWRQWQAGLAELLVGCRRVAMQYSPENALPYLATVDAGTVELVRRLGAEVVSSAALVARFQGLLDAVQVESHREAGERIHAVLAEVFAEIGRRSRTDRPMCEREAADAILAGFTARGIVPEGHGPNVSAGANAADPHYDPPASGSAALTTGTAVLIDLWGKLAGDARSVVYDITWCGWIGPEPPPAEYARRFEVAAAARDAALETIRRACDAGREVRGCDADDAARAVIEAAGYGAFFTHRTGHAIDTRTHGSGVNLDNFETCDTRPILPGACFSIEPGIYDPPWGVRTEINAVVHPVTRQLRVYGPVQRELVTL